MGEWEFEWLVTCDGYDPWAPEECEEITDFQWDPDVDPDPGYWKTALGERLRIEEMTHLHLRNVWNFLVRLSADSSPKGCAIKRELDRRDWLASG